MKLPELQFPPLWCLSYGCTRDFTSVTGYPGRTARRGYRNEYIAGNVLSAQQPGNDGPGRGNAPAAAGRTSGEDHGGRARRHPRHPRPPGGGTIPGRKKRSQCRSGGVRENRRPVARRRIPPSTRRCSPTGRRSRPRSCACVGCCVGVGLCVAAGDWVGVGFEVGVLPPLSPLSPALVPCLPPFPPSLPPVEPVPEVSGRITPEVSVEVGTALKSPSM